MSPINHHANPPPRDPHRDADRRPPSDDKHMDAASQISATKCRLLRQMNAQKCYEFAGGCFSVPCGEVARKSICRVKRVSRGCLRQQVDVGLFVVKIYTIQAIKGMTATVKINY